MQYLLILYLAISCHLSRITCPNFSWLQTFFSPPQAQNLIYMRETGLNLTKKTLSSTTFQLIGIRHYIKQALSRDFQCTCGKMHVQILLGMRWCAMSIFLFLKFYNFIKGIMRIHSIFKKPKTNVFILHLLTF